MRCNDIPQLFKDRQDRSVEVLVLAAEELQQHPALIRWNRRHVLQFWWNGHKSKFSIFHDYNYLFLSTDSNNLHCPSSLQILFQFIHTFKVVAPSNPNNKKQERGIVCSAGNKKEFERERRDSDPIEDHESEIQTDSVDCDGASVAAEIIFFLISHRLRLEEKLCDPFASSLSRQKANPTNVWSRRLGQRNKFDFNSGKVFEPLSFDKWDLLESFTTFSDNAIYTPGSNFVTEVLTFANSRFD
ncbi:hypothetical protein IEQ34_006455 [Dendrobium chrysotoxum]|uniref:Uncharacterized protein n=1 Tax=Dendrobium chrysotoxum TaxID=161865 RepID=A0AAV7HEU0_DENCH|nr:hypothetical protein IEQ34_006455 [Dendrobium chrysotoxum]